MSDPVTGDRTDFQLRDEREVKEPKKYKVLLHNDDYTTMDFVVEILVRVFHKSEAQATAIMLSVHNQGYGVCGTYTAEVAETKVDLVHKLAKSAGFPLKCSMEGE
ncbi:MAG: ATP-dependent Clp protease adapter ClpS [Pseudodesulfovibrio sp.]|jgi:ATP-dependent Clp protease adaptor protein ClpS|uniref:ATP-dependent Clp protease adapter protein ClpS n=1 Tax=Pseudodesulfovibrio indicus TaxID=1716143 RepID=A0A126QQA1_9BACT|nr:ATP-dependent Clp protease adapter ClpS [Pseudodesulfovibrio indicus]AMK11969.1 ATP-dependent Clp protease adaptor ClpS [Pseudodesulfovibrio indicus]TDT87242.1 ATP-dependent Clp protease adaptor protein ClpS [Pseudodesulfovibrio indicus]